MNAAKLTLSISPVLAREPHWEASAEILNMATRKQIAAYTC
jgi:hypothetical protein